MILDSGRSAPVLNLSRNHSNIFKMTTMLPGKGTDRNKRSADDLKKIDEESSATEFSDAASESADGSISRSLSEFSFVHETPSCLTRELKQLPMPTQEKVGQDLYGFSECVSIETVHFENLANEIDKVPIKRAYERAFAISPEYVSNQPFRLMFLRATRGNAKAAAKRMIRHFDTKIYLFGEEKLVKDIQISDLDEYDMEALESGGFQVLPERDLAGRSVLFGRFTCMRYREIKNMVRICSRFESTR
jgi:hypothetical protein